MAAFGAAARGGAEEKKKNQSGSAETPANLLYHQAAVCWRHGDSANQTQALFFYQPGAKP